MGISNDKIFHLGLCLAGSITAGAYTAGVMDYLIEALETWEEHKKSKDPSLPDYHVVIDLLTGTSGGGMTAAMSMFAMRDKIEHGALKVENGHNIFKPSINNIFWKSWVEMQETSAEPLFESLMDVSDIDQQNYVSSALNSKFIDNIAKEFSDYVTRLTNEGVTYQPQYLYPNNELCMMLFNVTGIRYSLITNAVDKLQYAMEHRDLGHFRWQENYPEINPDGRIEIHFRNMSRKSILIDAAKATGAFPVGFKARVLKRPAKYIWDNPFFQKGGRFKRHNTFLGEGVCSNEDIYETINADGGTANNEPIELCRELMYEMRVRSYGDILQQSKGSTITRREEVLKGLTNSSVLLIDPFPSVSGRVEKPITGQGAKNTDNLISYGGKLIGAMRSSLLIDAKLTLDAYEKKNYGLHLIAPSREKVEPENAIACGSLDGFGGFLSKEFRIHDFFLGRHNCQSFLRQYFVANLDEQDEHERKCIKNIIDAYKRNPAAKERFEFQDKEGKWWVPIIPDVTLKVPFNVSNPQNPLPTYILKQLEEDALDHNQPAITDRFMAIVRNIADFKGQGFINALIWLFRNKASGAIMDTIKDDLKSRDLMKGKMKNPSKKKPPQKPCPNVTSQGSQT